MLAMAAMRNAVGEPSAAEAAMACSSMSDMARRLITPGSPPPWSAPVRCSVPTTVAGRPSGPANHLPRSSSQIRAPDPRPSGQNG